MIAMKKTGLLVMSSQFYLLQRLWSSSLPIPSVFPPAAPSLSFFFPEPATVVGIRASCLSWIPHKTCPLLQTSRGLLSPLLLSIEQEGLMECTAFSWVWLKIHSSLSIHHKAENKMGLWTHSKRSKKLWRIPLSKLVNKPCGISESF